MDSQQSTTTLNVDRWSLLWLLLGTVFSLFSDGRWIISLTPWLSMVFWLRFIRTQKPLRGYFIAALASSVAGYFMMQGVAPMGATEYLITTVINGLVGMLPYLADRLMARRLKGFVSTLVFPLAATALGYLFALGAPFGTWGSVAYSQADNLPLIQIVSITGIWGITFLISWFASVVNWAWEQDFEWKRVRVGAGIYAAILAGVLLFGGARLAIFPPASDTVPVAGVDSPLFDVLQKEEIESPYAQGGFAALKWDTIFAKASVASDDLLRLSARAARAGAKIVLWTEGRALVSKQDEAALIERGRQLARQEQIYLGMALATILHTDASLLPQKKMLENKIVFIDPSGNVQWEYLKTIPVPGAEEAQTVKGDGNVPTLATPYGRIAGAICFDMDFPHLPRRAGQAGADLILVPAADWKAISPLHTYMASFRAIENGFSLMRVVRGGFSAAFDYQGRLLAGMDSFTTKDYLILAHVPTKGVTTIYSQIGDVFAWLSIAGFVALLGWIVAQGFRRG
jgi:apolipoprotein N-acyltransferase